MGPAQAGLAAHRAWAPSPDCVRDGSVHLSPLKALWFLTMATAALIGGALTLSVSAVAVFAAVTAAVLLLGHSLGSHRKLCHDSYQCPRWTGALPGLLRRAGRPRRPTGAALSPGPPWRPLESVLLAQSAQVFVDRDR